MRSIFLNLRALTAAVAVAVVAGAAGCGNSATAGGEDAAATSDSGGGATDVAVGGTDVASGTDIATDSAGTDAAPTLDLGGTDAADSGSGGGDADTTVAPSCPGGAGCACQSNSDCSNAAGKCIATPKGLKCAKPCDKEKCGADEQCITSGGAEPISICVPKWASICNPCSDNQECEKLDPGARCVSGGENGAFCGSKCTVDVDCPAGYECKEGQDVAGATSKQCVVKGGAACTCSEYALSLELSTVCYKVSGTAKCQGKRTCLSDGKPNAPPGGGLSSCYAPEPTKEICDGKDNDCNGKVDDAGICDDGKPCTDDNCKGAGGCDNPPKTGFCDADGTVCTKDDKCVNGECKTGDLLICDDKNECTKDSCDPKDGCKFVHDDGKSCNADDNLCTEGDACKAGKCEAGAEKPCASKDACTKGKCSTLDGKCKWTFQDTFPCNDGNLCTDKDKCDQAKGDCFGVVIQCDDQNPCTSDACDPTKGCVHDKSLSSPCDDGDACTTKDVCGGGVCAGTVVDPAKPKTAGGCADGNPCTTDLCNPAVGCQNKPDSTGPCDDGNPCTQGDVCATGTCKPGTNLCACTADSDCASKEDGNFCNGTLYCDKGAAPYTCKVNPATLVECSTAADGQCKSTKCEVGTGKCVTDKKADGMDCDADGTVCTDKDSCANGSCVAGKVVVCDDKNPCTKDACDPKKGCVFDYTVDPCDADQNLCTQNDVCKAGVCIAGAKKVCDDGEDCTQDSCTTATGLCAYTPIPNKTCEDGNSCTVGDGCKGGKCEAGAGQVCDDSNPCTKDSCDSKTGCTFKNDDTIKVPCYSGDPATKGNGQCKSGSSACAAGKVDPVCVGEVLPGKVELCDGADNNCDGVTDEGCKPTGFGARLGSAMVSGSAKTYGTRAFVGGTPAVGEAKGANHTANFGYFAWIKVLFKL